MLVKGWCDQNGITKSNYNYQHRRLRQVSLDILPAPAIPVVMEPVPSELWNTVSRPSAQCGIDITAGTFRIHVTESTSLELLSNALKMMFYDE